MRDKDFFLSAQILDQLHQPVLFAEGDAFCHCNQAAQGLLALETTNVEDVLSDGQSESYHAMTEGESLLLPVEINGALWEATITKSSNFATFVLGEQPRDHQLSLDVLPSIAYAIRDPLTQIFEAMDTLVPMLEEEENNVYQGLTAQVNQGMYRLLRISANMFDYPLFLESSRHLAIEKIDIPEFFGNHFRELKSLCAACKVTLEPSLKAKNLVGYFDQQQIFRLMLNLISNAVSASPEGGIIRLDVTAKSQMLQIRVEDKGAGIPPEILSSLFSQFDNGNLHVKKSSAAGFGLPIARQIAMSHGGNLMVNSAPDSGTLVIATAKIAPSDETVNAPTNQIDYTAGRNICALELAELLPVSEFDSRLI